MTKIIYLENTLKLFEAMNCLTEQEIVYLSTGEFKQTMKDENIRYLVMNEEEKQTV